MGHANPQTAGFSQVRSSLFRSSMVLTYRLEIEDPNSSHLRRTCLLYQIHQRDRLDLSLCRPLVASSLPPPRRIHNPSRRLHNRVNFSSLSPLAQ
jgi:hypothetical protein